MHQSICKFVSCLFFSFFFLAQLHAVPAIPYPTTIIQPDGSEITVYLKGNEFYHYRMTEDGYLLTRNDSGALTYGHLSENGDIVSTGVMARNVTKRSKEERRVLKTLSVHPDFSVLNRQARTMRTSSFANEVSLSDDGFPTTGTPKSLVILVNFADVEFVTPDPQNAFSRMLNERGYSENKGTGSARDYFRDNSMGVFEPEFVVVGPYTLPEKMAYYGKNVAGEDQNPQQMVIDACQLASLKGVDFSEYDTDNDGKVDNVFIFYAGYNEAEHGPDDSIWPHRWKVLYSNFQLDGKRIYDYACTSELRLSSGSEMCGIGTFVHEFGHVLGLPDYYTTNGASHFTLSEWSVMDSGGYLNQGRTPPAYSAYDRFFLNWLEPGLLTGTEDVVLEPLLNSNEAYLITQYDVHNLDGRNPSPVEFFTIENRQNTGWDTYLPGHGLLITRINYNATDWLNNSVNNAPNRMGVEIIRADGIASKSTQSGDPFPGTSEIDHYTPVLRNGTVLNKQLVGIQERAGMVSLTYTASGELLAPVAQEAEDITSTGFKASWQGVGLADYYYLSVYNVSGGTSQLTEGFDNKLVAPVGWLVNSKELTEDEQYVGKSSPAIVLSELDEYIQTERYVLPVSGLTFYAKPFAAATGKILVQAWNGMQWNTVDLFNFADIPGNSKEYTFDVEDNYVRFKFVYAAGTGKMAIDDITVSFEKRLHYDLRNLTVNTTSYHVDGLLPDFDYYYHVRAARNASTENALASGVSELSNLVNLHTSELANTIMLHTRKGAKSDLLTASVNSGVITVLITNDNFGKPIYVYDVAGRLVRKIDNSNSNFVEIKNLEKGLVYIIKVGELSTKVIL